MLDSLIARATSLMQEQAAAYARLEAACGQLAAAMVRDAPETIEALARAGEQELTSMRARLVEIMTTLAEFAENRTAASNNKSGKVAPLNQDVRANFEAASGELLNAARSFERAHGRAAPLAMSGSIFASACIEMCGVTPTTYRAPYTRRDATQGAR